MKKISMLAAVVLLMASATWVMAGPRGKAGNWDGNEWCPAASQLSTLNLSDEQLEKVRTLRESFLKETTPIRNQLVAKKAELRLLWIQTNPNADQIRSMQREIHDLMGQLQEKRTDYRLAFRGLLTPEQTTQFLAQGIGKGRGAGWGKGQGAGPAGRPGTGPCAGAGRGPGSLR